MQVQRIISCAVAVFAAVLLTSCNVPVDAEQEQAALAVYEDLRAGDLAAVEAALLESERTPQARQTLERILTIVPREAPRSTTRVTWEHYAGARFDTATLQSTSTNSVTFVHRYEYSNGEVFVTTVLVASEDGSTAVAGLHVNTYSADDIAANRFTVLDKPRHQQAFFVLMLCSVMLMVFAFFGAIFTKALPWKWAWAPLAWVGAPIFEMNWSTGEWVMRTAFGLINAGVWRGFSPVDAWNVKFQLPIGALLVLLVLMPHWWRSRPAETTTET